MDKKAIGDDIDVSSPALSGVREGGAHEPQSLRVADPPPDGQEYRWGPQWTDIQRDISKMTGLTFLTVDPSSGYRPQMPEENLLCRFLQDRPGGVELCRKDCGKAVLQSAQKNEIITFKCYGHLNNIAIPIHLPGKEPGRKVVILGGRTFFSYQDFADYRNQLQEMGGDPYKLLELTPFLVFKDNAFLERSARFVGRLAYGLVEQMNRQDLLQKGVSRLTTLFHVCREICGLINFPEIYRTVLSTVGVLYDSQTALLLSREKNKGNDIFRVAEIFGQRAEVLRNVTFQATDSLIGKVTTGNRMVFSSDGYEILKSGFPNDVISVHLFPMGGAGDVESILILLNSSLQSEDERQISTFCSHISMAIENRRLMEERSGRDGNISLLTDHLRSIISVMDSEDVYAGILEKASVMTQAGQGSLMILNEDTLELEVKATLGIHRSVLEHLRVKPGEGIAGMVLKTGDPWVVGNVEEDPRVMKPNRARYRGKSFLSFPLKAGEKAIGVLNLSDREGGRPFSEDEIPALEALTLFAAVAVERFRYYQSSMDLRRISITDVLSGLLNRRYFEERLAEEIERSKRYGEPFSLIILDIDNFKRFNDSYGHLIGDEGLRNTASGIRRCVRAIDIAARYGGEEFAVILPQTEKEEARSIGDRIREEIELGGIEIPGEDQKARLTVSIGIACYPTDAAYHEELIRHADRALYHAKAQGKNRVVLYREM